MKSKSLAILSIGCSLSSIILGFLGFIPGIFLGHIARKKCSKEESGDTIYLANAGLIIGYLFLLFTVLILIFYCLRTTS